MKNFKILTLLIVGIYLIGIWLPSCQNGHMQQTWQPRHSNKGGKPYRR
jgi:hypothetical protein